MVTTQYLSKEEEIRLYRTLKKKKLAEMLYEANKLLNQFSNQNYYITTTNEIPPIFCMHDNCLSCHDTGVKVNGSMCIHHISCPCPKCSPSCFTTFSVTNNID
jgi:hypothetical protein